jgi:hypothetical protein
MNKKIYKISGTIFISLLFTFFIFLNGHGFDLSSANPLEKQEQEAKEAEMYKDVHPLINESDLYSSFFLLERGQKLEIKIVGAKAEKDRILLRENDIVYLNKGRDDGIEPGQVFLVLEIGRQFRNPITREKYGNLAKKKGRARITAVSRDRAQARLEKLTGETQVGDSLYPFEEKKGLLGKDLGLDISPSEEGVTNGTFVYLHNDYNHIGSGYWALIDLGEEHGLQFGQQLFAYRLSTEAVSLNVIASLIVIDTQRTTSTVKVLSCSEPIIMGDRVRTR